MEPLVRHITLHCQTRSSTVLNNAPTDTFALHPRDLQARREKDRGGQSRKLIFVCYTAVKCDESLWLRLLPLHASLKACIHSYNKDQFIVAIAMCTIVHAY